MIEDRTSKGTRTAWVARSDDDGATWSKPTDITKDVKKSNWTWYATGPGVGIQLKSGRLVVPCDHYVAGTKAQIGPQFTDMNPVIRPKMPMA